MAIRGRSRFDASRPDRGPRLVRSVSGPATRPNPGATRPAWTWLYALLPLCVALMALLDYVPSSEGQRTVAEVLVVALVIGLAALWVRANRRALSRLPSQTEPGADAHGVTVEVREASPRIIHLAPRRSRSEN